MNERLQNSQSGDAEELVRLLREQAATLKAIYWDATEQPGKYAKVGEIASFISLHSLSIQELSVAATTLMEVNRPFGTVTLARSALEGLFNLVAACKDSKFAAQKLSYELDDLARKLEQLIKNGSWLEVQNPTPQQCKDSAEEIRKKYGVEAKQWKQTEQIAIKAELSDFYDDYRLLSLAVHSNQAGILNAGSGFLVRQGLLAISNCLCLASFFLGRAFKVLGKHESQLHLQRERMESLMKKPFSLHAWVERLCEPAKGGEVGS